MVARAHPKGGKAQHSYETLFFQLIEVFLQQPIKHEHNGHNQYTDAPLDYCNTRVY
jgi:hypothetical protein